MWPGGPLGPRPFFRSGKDHKEDRPYMKHGRRKSSGIWCAIGGFLGGPKKERNISIYIIYIVFLLLFS
jgi:hypothetical protein